MSTNKINYEFRTGYELSPKQMVSIGIVIFVALSALALGTMALLNLKSNITVFHALGGMKEIGAWVLMGIGAAALTGVLSYLAYKCIQHDSTWLDHELDPKEIRKRFDELAAQEIEGHIINRTRRGRYAVWQPNQIDGAMQRVYILRIDPDKTCTLIGFMTPDIKEIKEVEECSRGELGNYREMLTEKAYLYRPLREQIAVE